MQTATSDTYRGRWIDFRNAEEIFKIKSMKKMKLLCPPNMAFGHGSNVTAPYPYNKFDFVYLCPTAPDTWTASNNYSIRLRGWCQLCLYFSDESNTSKPESMYCDLFSDYTGLPATVENITHSFKDKLLISSDSLQEQLKDREAAKSKAKKMKRHESTLALSDHDTMTMTDEEEGGRGFITVGGNHNEHQGDDSHHRSYRCTLVKKHLRKFNNTACIFLLGFILGTIVIVGLSITFDKTPIEETYSDNFEGKVHLGDSMDNTNAIEVDDIDEDESATTKTLDVINEAKKEEQTEEEYDFTNFCKKCQWKNSVFDCSQRVRWEMKQYHMSEHEAMETNVDHCMSPGGVPPPNEKTLEEKEEENEEKMEEELEKEEVGSAATASP